ncbi:MAG: glycogen synthase GlgA [Oxalobacteraceae bacterium]|nr:glycogen synthase GlgA [Oxalobacteraceae bacterium]
MRPRVLLVASEAIPLVKTGGLADVITALAGALHEKNIEVSIFLPGYPSALAGATALAKVAVLDDLPGGPACLYRGRMPDSKIPVILLETESFRVRSGNPYVDANGDEYPDNAVSFAALCHAAVRICAARTPLAAPHIVHANDWHAGLIPLLLRSNDIKQIGSVLTIHNLAFQGNYPIELGPSLGIPADLLNPDGIELWGKLSFLKAGIQYADRISIVSESYAREVLTPQFGNGLDGILNHRKQAIVAISNGIDMRLWNPAKDPLIARHFTQRTLRNKNFCKQDLLAMFKLPADPFAPLLALGSRITHQKMADVALAALPAILDKYPRMQVVVLGRGERAYEDGFIELSRRYPGRLGVHIGYEERLAHALHAGADMLLHGTRFEPYGLTPIYSMRYGTIPIASRVGGLIDTIIDAGTGSTPCKGANGILFDGEQAADMIAAVDRAFKMFGNSDHWLTMQRNAMSGDFSWHDPVRKYVEMYSEIASAAAKPLFAAALSAKSCRLPDLAVARR